MRARRSGRSRQIVASAHAALGERWWPVHDLDYEIGDPEVWHGVHMGAAGMLLALERLGSPVDRRVLPSYLAAPEFDRAPAMWIGESGIVLVDYLRSREPALADRLAELLVVPEPDTLELMWGSPGLLVIADVMERVTGEARWGAGRRRARRAHRGAPSGCRSSTASALAYLGPAHGFAGIVAALARRGVVDPRTLPMLRAHAHPRGRRS